MSKIEPRNLKGFRDYAPPEQLARQAMFSKIQSVFERFGFLPLSTPVLEYAEVLMGKSGEEADKLSYRFKDNGDRDVAMRYDLTVPLARFVAQNQGRLTYPFKRYQIAPVWRGENTQRGRLREFYQCDIDIVGTNSLIADAEIIACICSVFDALDIKNYLVRLNNRQNFEGFKFKQIETIRTIDKTDKIGIDGVIAELNNLELPAEQIEQVRSLLQQGDEAKPDQRSKAIIDTSIGLGVNPNQIIFDPTIARGLDYYTSTVFEVILKNNPEFGSILGGGRYDKLVDTFSDKPLPAVGGSIGIDRLFEALESMGNLPTALGVEVVVLNLGESMRAETLRVVSEMREEGINVDLYYEEAKLDKQFKYAENKGARLAVIIGEEEKAKGTVKVKNLQTREQIEVLETELLAAVKSI